MSEAEFFRSYHQTEIPIRQYRGKVPLFFRSVAAMGAVFTADLSAIRMALPSSVLSRFKPVELIPGRGVVAIQCMEYAETDIGPYNEVALSVLVRRGVKPSLWVQELPVTTEAAVYGGLDYFGFPKYLATIEFRDSRRHRVCTLRDRETEASILELETRRPALTFRRPRVFTIETLSLLNGTLLRGRMAIRAEEYGVSVLPGSSVLRIQEHPRAASFRRLGLGQALSSFVVSRAQAVMELPRP